MPYTSPYATCLPLSTASAPKLTSELCTASIDDNKSTLIENIRNIYSKLQTWPALIKLFNINHVREVLLEKGFVPKTYRTSIWHTAGAWMLAAILCTLVRNCSKEQLYFYYRLLCEFEGVVAVSSRTMIRAMEQEEAVSAAIRSLSLELSAELSKEIYDKELNTLGRQLLEAVRKIDPAITRIVAGDGSDRPLAREENEGETRGSAMAGRKTHAIMDLALGVVVHYMIGSSLSNEREALISMIVNDKFAPGTLYLLDAGYLSRELINCIIRRNAYYIIKARKSINASVVRAVEYDSHRDINGIYQISDEGREVTFDGPVKIKDLRAKGLISPPVTGKDGRLVGKSYVLTRADRTKILMVFNPENKSYDERATESSWVYFETNLSDAFNVRILSVLYRPRWQLEIKFLCLKSHGGMDCGKDLNHHSSDLFVSASMMADCLKMYIALISSYSSEELESRKDAVLMGKPSRVKVEVSSEKAASKLSLDALFYILCKMPVGNLVSPSARRHGSYRFRSIAAAVNPGRVSSLTMKQGKSFRSTLEAVESYAESHESACTAKDSLQA